MEPVAQTLSSFFGVLEPIQNATTVNGQIDELRDTLQSEAGKPIVLAGHSWGAWLALLCAAKNPEIVKKLILISSGPLELKYVSSISENRCRRLDENDRKEYLDLLNRLNNSNSSNRSDDLSRLGALAQKADTFEQIEDPPYSTPANELTDDPGNIYSSVWPEADKLRQTGELLNHAKNIKCPVAIVQGDSDSHPLKGVKEPLSQYIDNLNIYELKNCGHSPWLEKNASVLFYEILLREVEKQNKRPKFPEKHVKK